MVEYVELLKCFNLYDCMVLMFDALVFDMDMILLPEFSFPYFMEG